MKHAFATGKDGDKVMALVTDKLSSKSAVEWHEFFTHSSRNLPITRVRAPEELYGDDLLEKRKMILTMPTVDGTTTCVMKPALDYTNFVTSNDHHAPTLGEHNQYLSDLLLSKM
jgi:crotonobetainyl-CoA:carnitine CoA-transferase CaiB-like acyl-CoA transferase